MLEMSLGNTIKTARKKANISKQELADKCEISYMGLILIEKDAVNQPRLSTLKSFSELLHLDGEELRKKAGYIPKHSPEDNSFGAVVERARLEMFLSQTELAELCNVKPTTIQYIELGKRKRAYTRVLKALSGILKITSE